MIAAVEDRQPASTLVARIRAREQELRDIDAKVLALRNTSTHSTPIITTWVRRQLEDVSSLLDEAPERARAEFVRLQLRFALHPVYEEGARPFLRAEGSGSFEHLAFAKSQPFSATGASLLRTIGNRKFVVDLPPNRLGPGWRQNLAG